jgi:hypothetical protein
MAKDRPAGERHDEDPDQDRKGVARSAEDE